MLEVLPLLLFSCIFAVFGHVFSNYDSLNLKYKRKSTIINSIGIVIAVFAGLRTKYNDTSTYIETYDVFISNEGSIFNNVLSPNGKIQWFSIGSNPGFVFIQNVIKHLGFDSQDFIMAFAVVTIVIYFWFIKKYSSNYILSIFLFFTFGIFSMTIAAIKQCFAIAMGLIAIDGFLNNKKAKFVFFILLGMTVHPYVALFFLSPFFLYKPWSRKTNYLIIGFAFVGVLFQSIIGRLVDLTNWIGEEYTVDELTENTVNPIRVLIYLAPIVVSFIVKKNINNNDYDKRHCLFVNFTMLNGLLMFLALFGNAVYFGRLSEYFSIFTIISLPWMLSFLDDKHKNLVKIAAVILFAIFYCYESMYGGSDTFDEMFEKIKLIDYLKTVF